MLATTAAMSEQFNKNNILILEEMGYEVHVAGNWKEGNPISYERLEQFKEWLAEHQGKWFHIPATRKPYDLRNNFVAYKEVVRLIKEYEYEFIHCHTPIGSVIGRIAAHFTKTKIIYTAHGFHFYKGAPLINWFMYYPVEWFLSYWTDVLITINKEDYQKAQEKFHAKKIEYVPGIGIELEKFSTSCKDKKIIRQQIGLSGKEFLVLSVGELIKRKNHEIGIRAIAEINKRGNILDIHYIICGSGPLMNYLEELANKLNVGEYVHFLGYRTDVVELCHCSDVFLFMSQQEGLPVALMEAMACQLPVICSKIRGNVDLIEHGINGLFCTNCSYDLADMILELLENKEIQKEYGNNAKEKVGQFESKMIDEKMKVEYEEILQKREEVQ